MGFITLKMILPMPCILIAMSVPLTIRGHPLTFSIQVITHIPDMPWAGVTTAGFQSALTMLIPRGTTPTIVMVTIIHRIGATITMPTIRPGGPTGAIVRAITTVAKTKSTIVVVNMIAMPGVEVVITMMSTKMTGVRKTTIENVTQEQLVMRRSGVMFQRHHPDIQATGAW